ncbi:MAG: glycosyltransferase family 39 protein, partial [Candidatus Omnitrophica bacterium]|nr:glycosyltransferase family 39 protein [Candidatus Omnitrophota bacterium]
MLIRSQNWLVWGVFAFLLMLGLSIYDDYGISWDEDIQRITGYVNYRYITGVSDQLKTFIVRFYGPVFEIILVAAERMFKVSNDLRKVYLLRHALTFLLMYIGMIYLYKICSYRYQHWKWGIVGVLFLVLSPRIFAHAFYNCKDIPFMVFFLIAMYTFLRYLDDPTIYRCLCHALASALAIDIRVMGIILPIYTIFFIGVRLLINREYRVQWKRTSVSLCVYVIVTVALMVLFWPTLWENTWGNLIAAFFDLGKH